MLVRALEVAHLNAVQCIQPIGALEKSQARIRLGLIFMNTRPMLSFTIWLSRASVDEIISRKLLPRERIPHATFANK